MKKTDQGEAAPATAGDQIKEMIMGSGSMTERCRRVKDAYNATVKPVEQANPSAPVFYVEDVFEDHIIVEHGAEWMKVPYTMTDAGDITFGTPVHVTPKTTFTPVTEAVQASLDLTELTAWSDNGEAHLIESKSPDGSKWVIRVIAPGWSKNFTDGARKVQRYYPEATLRAAVPLFEGVAVYAHFTTQHVSGPQQQSAQAKVGWLDRPRYDRGICADFTCVDPPLRTKLKEAWDHGKKDFLGFSLDGHGRDEPKIIEGRKAASVEAITAVNELSVVTAPAAGGEFVRLVASADSPHKEDGMLERLKDLIRKINPKLLESEPAGGWTEATLEAVLIEAKAAPAEPIVDVKRLKETEDKIADILAKSQRMERVQTLKETVAGHVIAGHPKAKALVEARGMQLIEAGAEVTAEQIIAMADEQMTVLAEASPSGKVQGLGTTATVTQDEREKMVIHAMDGLFEGRNMNEVPRFTGLHEAYCKITGRNYFDCDNRTIFQETVGNRSYDSRGRRLTESVTTTDWAQIFGDSVTRKMVRDYRQSAQYDAWRSIVSEISSPKDFRTQRRTRLGGYGLLPTVAQGGPYNPLTSPGDEEATFTPAKKGGTEDLTWESVLNDDIASIRQIPIRLARAAKITLYRFVMNDLIIANPTIYDGDTLFHANHNNTFTNTLITAGSLLIAENAMLAQAAYGEATNNLGLTPRYFLTVRARRDDAWKLLTGDTAVVSGENATTPNMFKGKYRPWEGGNPEPFHVANFDSSTTRYILIADPQDIPTIEIGFLGGQQEPELFVQDDQRVGSTFNADKTTLKIRHVYSGTVLDFRGFVQGNA